MSPTLDPSAAERALSLCLAESRSPGGEGFAGGDGIPGALRQAYRGRHDVVDALWWRVHPLTVAPSGAVDPASDRAALQALAFARPDSGVDASADRSDAPDPSAPLEALERALDADAAALDAALAAVAPALADAQHPFAAAAAAQHPLAAEPDATSPPDTAPPEADPSPGLWRRRSGIWMYTTIAAGALLLVAVALIVVQAVAGPGSIGVAQGAGAASTSPSPLADGSNAAGLTIFEDPSKAPEIPPANIDPYYQPDTLRLLGVANSDLTVYAVENRVGDPCLLAVYTDGTQSAVCVSRAEFATQGIQLRLTSLRVTRATDPAPYRTIAQDVVFWNKDGSYGISSSTAK